MSQESINGMISLKEISNLKVAISVVIGLSRRRMVTQLTTLRLLLMTTICKFHTLSVEMTTLPIHQNSLWFMKLLVGKRLSLDI